MIRHLAAASAFSLVLIGGLSAATGGSDQSTATVAAVRPATAAPATVTTASGRAVAALAAAPADLFAPVSPARLLDTRKGAYSIDSQFVGSGITTPGGTLALQVTGRGGVPAGAGAAVLNVTAAEATGPGYLTVYPCGEAVPGSSSLNYSLNRDVANAVLTKLSADGKVCIRTGVNNTQVVADVTGYFPGGSTYAPLSPARVLDTRPAAVTIDRQAVGAGITKPGGTLQLQVTGRGGVPAGASAAVLNVTAAEATGPGYLTVYPCGEAVPGSSSLNYSLNRDVANAVLTKLSADGKVCIRTGVNNTQVVADVTGYFPPGSSFTPLSPARILDTRPGTSTIDKQAVGSGLTPASSTLQLLVSGRGGVPATAGAVVLNVTAADATGAGYLTVYPCGEPVPGSSSLNFSLNRDVANAVLTKIGSGGKVCIRTGINATHIVADVTGYLDTGAAPPLPTGPGTSASCRFLTTSTTAAMCDSFDEAEKDPATRTGDLNATLWGVSRIGSFKDNTFYPATLTGCGATQKVLPPNDVRICNGRLFDASMDLSPEDDGGQIGLAMYPKQPFDIAGRTGTVVFDVSADANSVHSAWPEFWWTDQPVPAPHGHLTTAAPYARNSFGFAVAQACGSNGTTVSAMQVTRNYAFDDLPFTTVGCIAKGSATGQLNHFEVKINQNRVEVWATNPGASDIQLLAYADNTNITMTRGLIWIEDVHYNACKFATDMQCDHQLGWDNVGFDGPTPYRDLSFDVADAKVAKPDGTLQLGYTAGPTPLAVQTVPVYRLQTPTSAIVTLNWWPYNQFVPSIRINGGPWHDTAWPFDPETFTWRTIAIPVAVSETIDGPNTIEIRAGENVLVANINLILIAASPVP